MRRKKLMNDTFYVNVSGYTGVDTVDSLTNDMYFHYTEVSTSTYKISGATYETASGKIAD
jgi:hypothetical protein